MNINVYREKQGENELLGTIRHKGGGSAFFSYDAVYLAEAVRLGELGVSERLPLDDAAYSQSDFAPLFFQGLLPLISSRRLEGARKT